MTPEDVDGLAHQAALLRDLHDGFLVLANVWDAPTAEIVTELGFDAVATSSAAIARTLGSADGERLNPDAVFHHIGTPLTSTLRSKSVEVDTSTESPRPADSCSSCGERAALTVT